MRERLACVGENIVKTATDRQEQERWRRGRGLFPFFFLVGEIRDLLDRRWWGRGVRRASTGYRHCGFSATEKNLIIICRGWQLGIWLVEIFSAVLNSCCKFSGIGRSLRKTFSIAVVRFCRDGEGRIWRCIVARSVCLFSFLFFSFAWRLQVAWPLRHSATVTHTHRFPHLSPGWRPDTADPLAVLNSPPSHHPQESVGLTRRGRNGFHWSPSFQLSSSFPPTAFRFFIKFNRHTVNVPNSPTPPALSFQDPK